MKTTDKNNELRLVIRQFLNWQRVACGCNGDAYLNGEIDKAGNERNEGASHNPAFSDKLRDGWDDLDDICKRARKALKGTR